MRILMVGGTGLIGPYVARELHDRGHDVTLFHRGQHESDLVRAEFEVLIHMIPMGEADARAGVHAFAGRTERLVALSSGDVCRAYGRFTGLEPGHVEEGLLTE